MEARDQGAASRVRQFLQAELAPYPGRLNLTLRSALASALVIVTSMTLQVPFLAVSIITVFYVTQSNVVLTRLIGILSIAGTTLAIASAILLLKVSYNQPLIRILAASAMFFVSVYLMRVTKFGLVFFIGGIVFIYVQSFVDVTDQAELVVRTVLWAWVAISYAVAVTLLVNTLLLPAEPAVQLKAEMRRQLRLVRQLLAGRTGDAPALEASHGPQQSALALHKLLRFTIMREASYREREATHLGRIAAVSRLYEEARQLQAEPGARVVTPGLEELREDCDRLDAAIAEDRRFTLGRPAPLSPGDQEHALVLTMRHTLQSLADREAASAPGAVAPPRERLVLPDAFSNPVYAQFALKTLAAALIGYVFYTGVQWQGIHTVMLTALIVAQPSLGATTQRGLLRVVGALVGSAIALLMVVFVVPQLDDIVGLLAIALPVVAMGAWVAAGSERVNYAGTQLVFTFAMALLAGFGPTTDLTEIRDRIIGILLGVALSLVIHSTLAPEAEGEVMRQRLADLLRHLSELLLFPVEQPHDALALTQQYLRARERQADCEAIIARVALEPDWQQLSGESEQVTLYAQEALGQAGQILAAIQAFHGELGARAAALPPAARRAALSIRDEAASELARYADALAVRPMESLSPSSISLEDLLRATRGAGDETAAVTLHARLVGCARKLVDEVSALPRWAASDDVPAAIPTHSPV